MNSSIYYQFYDSKPNSTFNFSKSMSASIIASSENILGKVTFTKKYYYNIKKEEYGKYLIISYSGFKDSIFIGKYYLEIEHTRVNWAITIIIIIFSVVGLSIIIVIAAYCIKRYKSKNLIDYQAIIPSYTPPSSILSQYNQNNTGNDSTTFNNNPEQQNIYYKPSQASINH